MDSKRDTEWDLEESKIIILRALPPAGDFRVADTPYVQERARARLGDEPGSHEPRVVTAKCLR